MEERRRKEIEELLAEPAEPESAPSLPTVTPATPTSASKAVSPRSRRGLSARVHPPSPLRSEGLSSSSSSPPLPTHRTPPAVSRRRSRKGPATPLARFVTHKIVAEKLASVKVQKALRAGSQSEKEEEGRVPEKEGEVSGERSSKTAASEWSTSHSDEEPQGLTLRPSGKANQQVAGKSLTTSRPGSHSALQSSKSAKSSSSHSTVRTTRPLPSTGTSLSGSTSLAQSQLKVSQSRGATTSSSLSSSASMSLPSSALTTSQSRSKDPNLFKASGMGPDAAARRRQGERLWK